MTTETSGEITFLRPRDFRRCIAVALVIGLGVHSVSFYPLMGQTPPLQVIPIAAGSAPDADIKIKAKGPTEVAVVAFVFQPGGDTGWHTHPGPVVVVVKTGALTEYHDDGCQIVHPAGSFFFEPDGIVHRAVNQTGIVTEVYATFIAPPASQLLLPAADPGGVCRNGR